MVSAASRYSSVVQVASDSGNKLIVSVVKNKRPRIEKAETDDRRGDR